MVWIISPINEVRTTAEDSPFIFYFLTSETAMCNTFQEWDGGQHDSQVGKLTSSGRTRTRDFYIHTPRPCPLGYGRSWAPCVTFLRLDMPSANIMIQQRGFLNLYVFPKCAQLQLRNGYLFQLRSPLLKTDRSC